MDIAIKVSSRPLFSLPSSLVHALSHIQHYSFFFLILLLWLCHPFFLSHPPPPSCSLPIVCSTLPWSWHCHRFSCSGHIFGLIIYYISLYANKFLERSSFQRSLVDINAGRGYLGSSSLINPTDQNLDDRSIFLIGLEYFRDNTCHPYMLLSPFPVVWNRLFEALNFNIATLR